MGTSATRTLNIDLKSHRDGKTGLNWKSQEVNRGQEWVAALVKVRLRSVLLVVFINIIPHNNLAFGLIQPAVNLVQRVTFHREMLAPTLRDAIIRAACSSPSLSRWNRPDTERRHPITSNTAATNEQHAPGPHVHPILFFFL